MYPSIFVLPLGTAICELGVSWRFLYPLGVFDQWFYSYSNAFNIWYGRRKYGKIRFTVSTRLVLCFLPVYDSIKKRRVFYTSQFSYSMWNSLHAFFTWLFWPKCAHQLFIKMLNACFDGNTMIDFSKHFHTLKRIIHYLNDYWTKQLKNISIGLVIRITDFLNIQVNVLFEISNGVEFKLIFLLNE